MSDFFSLRFNLFVIKHNNIICYERLKKLLCRSQYPYLILYLDERNSDLDVNNFYMQHYQITGRTQRQMDYYFHEIYTNSSHCVWGATMPFRFVLISSGWAGCHVNPFSGWVYASTCWPDFFQTRPNLTRLLSWSGLTAWAASPH